MICGICYSHFGRKRKRVNINCACRVCRECFADWVHSRLRDFGTPEFNVTCLTSTHHNSLSRQLLSRTLSQSDFDLYDLTLLKRLARGDDYFDCPKCNTVSWSPRSYCLRGSACPYCRYSHHSAVIRLIRSVSAGVEDCVSMLRIEALSQCCPGCAARIQRSAGCDSMVCTRCSTHFCYSCGKRYASHDPTKCCMSLALKAAWGATVLFVAIVRVGYAVPRDLLETADVYADVAFLFLFLATLATLLLLATYRVLLSPHNFRSFCLLVVFDLATFPVFRLYFLYYATECCKFLWLLTVSLAFVLPSGIVYRRLSR